MQHYYSHYHQLVGNNFQFQFTWPQDDYYNTMLRYIEKPILLKSAILILNQDEEK